MPSGSTAGPAGGRFLSLSFRQPNFIGDLDSESDAVWLPLRKGDNELVLAMTEYFGGWAFLCRLAP